MANTYVSCLLHCVFSTKGRQRTITSEHRARLHAYMATVARNHGMRDVVVGGTSDHVHLLLSLPATSPISKAMQEVKGVSSSWAGDVFPEGPRIEWQEGYGAFSVGAGGRQGVEAYIARQEERHQTVSFQEEFIDFLKRNGVEYDPRYVWG